MKLLGARIFGAVLTLLLVPVTAAWSTPQVDHHLWDELLKKHVLAGVVDYAGFKAEEKKFDSYLDLLARTDYQALESSERYAFLINLYNAWTIKLILGKWPDLRSIKDLGSFLSSPWKKEIVILKTGRVSLDHVEHDLLRPEARDPRAHFALNCASKGCPPLASFAFTGERLDQQLEQITRSFINDPQRTVLEGNELKLNKIFRWYGEDFGGKVDFVRKYAEGDLKARLAALGDRVEIGYLPYDWSLNGQGGGG